MHEEINEKSISLVVRVGKVTAAELKKAIEKLIAELDKSLNQIEAAKDKPETQKDKPGAELKHGKQTLKELHKHNDGLSSVELNNPHLRKLQREMKKADIDFAAVKDGKGKYTLFFKGKNADEMTRAFKQYTKKVVKIEDKKAIRQELREAKAAAKALNNDRSKEKNRSKGARDR